MLGYELAWTCAGLMQAATAAVCPQAWLSCHAQKIPFHSGPPGPLTPVDVLQKKVSWVGSQSLHGSLSYPFYCFNKSDLMEKISIWTRGLKGKLCQWKHEVTGHPVSVVTKQRLNLVLYLLSHCPHLIQSGTPTQIVIPICKVGPSSSSKHPWNLL